MIPFEPFRKIIGGFLGKNENLEEASKGSFFRMVQVDQVHGDQVHLIQKEEDVSKVDQKPGDAIICSVSGVGVAVRTADCVPILLAHPYGVVAAVHAGWRGTQTEILIKTLSILEEQLNLPLNEVRMAIGPSICDQCYEVGQEVADKFIKFKQTFQISAQSHQYYLDLKAINHQQAVSAGISPIHIDICKECTFCQSEFFYSYRKGLAEGKSSIGRNYSWVGMS